MKELQVLRYQLVILNNQKYYIVIEILIRDITKILMHS